MLPPSDRPMAVITTLPRGDIMIDGIKGLFVGALLGAVAGLSVCVWLLTETLLFPGDTILLGAIIGTVCGYLWGDDFFDWVKDNWWWFS